jgi:hypothetical protein
VRRYDSASARIWSIAAMARPSQNEIGVPAVGTPMVRRRSDRHYIFFQELFA